MRRSVLSVGVGAVISVAAWRLVSELIARMRVLRSSGELQMRVAARRARALAIALERASIHAAAVDAERVRVHAAVLVGPGRAGDLDDIDDIALLEGAMRRAGRERIESRGRRHGMRPPARHAEPSGHGNRGQAREWSWLAEDPAHEHVGTEVEGREARAPVWAVGAALAAVLVTLVPLVRPLGDAAPWLAIAAVALTAAAAIALRHR